LLTSIAVLSCAYAAYGLFAFALTPGRVLWFDRPFATTGFITSTFINPNSFATYAGIGLIVICGLIIGLYRNEFGAVGGSIRFRIANFIEVTGRKGAMLFGGALLIVAALLLSQSRGGVLSAGLGLCVFGASTFRTKQHRLVEQRAAIIILGAVLLGVAFLVFGDLLVGRIRQQGFWDSGRPAVYTITIRSILDAPLTGYGYGTFRDIFPMFRDQSAGTFGKWDMAHDTYLEVFQGLGLVFGLLLVASIVLLASRCVKGATTRQENEMIPCVGAAVAGLVAVNSLVDFSLQIQAVGLTFMALLGAGVAQSKSSRLTLGD
jgi:O-antigen ligase